MSSDIQLLTNRLLAALNSNYEVIDTSEVLLVISQLEQTTITKKQLEATRLGKYINLLRSRTWSESLARRAKNLIKKWRNLVITPATVGVGGSGGGSQQSQSQQHHPHQSNQSESQSVMKHHQILHVSLSQPTSPVVQSNDNQKSSRHYPGQPRNIENCSLPEYPCSGSGSSSIIKDVPSTSRKQQLQHQQHASSLSNGGQQLAGAHKSHSGKSTSLFSKTSNKSPQLSQATKKQPISFANLIESQLHPPGGGGVGGGSQGVLGPGAGPSSFLVDDNRSQSPLTLPRIPRIPRDRQSPMIIEHSVSPLDLDQNSNPSREGSLALPSIATGPANLAVMNNNTISSCSRLLNGDYAATSIDLHDSNSDSEMIGNLRDSMIEVQRFLENRSSEHRKSKKHKKDKRRHKQERLHDSSVPSDEVITKSTGRNDQIPLLSDETQICGCNTFPIQETLSLSNSSLSRFPSTSTNITITATNRGLGNNTVTKIKSDLTFAGKFKKTSPNNAGSLLLGGSTVPTTQVPPTTVDGLGGDDGNIVPRDDPNHPLVGNGKDAAAAASYPTVINPAKKSKRNDGRSSVVVIESRSCSPFTPILGNSNDSTSSSSHNSAQDLIEVVNHESQGLDDIRMRPITSILPQQLLQQQPTQPLKPAMAAVETQESLVPKENKIPKRRGRKKGSKGADAMLAQFNNQLFEGSKLLSLASLSSSKKVKTTKELLADIQNRKLESTVSSPTLTFQSRPPSTSSEPSLHSASTSDACSTNATISTVARSTPDKNIVLVAPFRPSGVDEDSGSNMSGSGIVLKKEHPGSDGDVKLHPHGTKVEAATSIEEDIQRLMNSLPVVKREEIDWVAGDDVICTCTVKETEPQLQPDGVVLEKDDDDNRGDLYDENFKFQVIIKPPPTEIRPISRQEDDGISVNIRRSPSPSKVKVQHKPVKSIFDLDYDEENDPLRSFVEAAKTVKVETSGGVVDDSKFPAQEHESHEKVISVSLPAHMPKPEVMPFIAELQPLNSIGGGFEAGLQTQGLPQNFPQFELIEDPHCPAKQRYEIQTNCITKFHVHSLHNRYVPGVNGNWDQSDCCKDEVDSADSGATLTPDGFYERVVPQYNFLVMDKIPKDLSHMRFGRNYNKGKQGRQLRMKRKRSPSSTNGPEEGELFKHQRNECPSSNLGKMDDIVAIAVKPEIGDGFDSNMNLSNCSDKAAATDGSPTKLVDAGNEPIVRGLIRGSEGGDTTEHTTPLSNHSSNHNSNGGSRRSSSCSNSSVNLSNPLSCSNNGSKPNVSVSHNLSNNIDDTGDNSVDNCSEYREDGDEDDEGAFYDDEDEDDDEDDEDHGKFQVQVVEPESTWSTSTVGNKLVLTLKKTPLSLSFKCTDKAGTSRKRDNGGEGERVGNVRVKVEDEGGKEVSDRNGNEMAVAPNTVDSLSNNVASSGWNERAPYVCDLNEPSATTTTTTTTIITTTTSTKKQQSAIELRDHPTKGVVINQMDFEALQIVEVNENLTCSGSIDRCNDSKDDQEDNDDFEDMATFCSSPGLNRKCEEDEDKEKTVVKIEVPHQLDEMSSESILSQTKDEEEDYLNDVEDEDDDDVSSGGDPDMPEGNNELLSSFNCLNESNRTGFRTDGNTGKPQQFKEWHEVLQLRSYNDELLTILPYVVID